MQGAKEFKDHYATLGVAPTATRTQIRSARNRLLRLHHPDLHAGSGSDGAAKEKTLDILLAAEVLLDDDARREYDRTYRYVRGGKRAPSPSPPAREESRKRGVACERCERQNSWGRSYCLYCGAGIGDASSGISVDEILSRDLLQEDRAGAYVHFGCGALLGFVVVTLFGFRAFAASGVDSPLPIAILVAFGMIAFGVAAALLRDRFWWTLVRYFFFLPLLVLYLLLPLVAAHHAREDGIVLFGLAVGFLGLFVWLLTRGRWYDFIPHRRRRRPK